MTSFLAAALLLSAGAAHAQRVSPMQAGRFAQYCRSPRNGGQQICDAYITGMADSFALIQKLPGGSSGDLRKAGICVPRTASGAAMRQAVMSWLGSHQNMLGKQVGETVYYALHDTYPCGAG
ncbi:Rap1a/Tai family immunity protein [Lichenicoccus sp.]|uniref:Rap1a/Tai family immunity protein n=1 Tax=Lichenicoccus sp. TaxID=2781899 RepID=UPI003D0DDC9A